MAGRPLERKLAAILSADVEGYSRLMGDDEAGTVRTITEYREVVAAGVTGHGGRVVDAPGDNVLAEFASVVDAVQAAIEIQRALHARNAELPAARRMRFRIGINLGDVIVEGDRLYGDGVNIAARVQGLADGGGIVVSGAAYDQVTGKLPLRWEAMGEHAVKNIARPVRVYRARLDPAAPRAPRARGRRTVRVVAAIVVAALLGAGGWAGWRWLRPSEPALALPDKPSVAVLPFLNLSQDPSQEYFSDGVTEDLITDLAKVSGLFVIARNSVFTYKGKPVKVGDVGRDLGVRYVVEGSIQRAGDRLRITAQLVDARTGFHVWAERYDRQTRDIFAVKDEVIRQIVGALAVRLTEPEKQRLARTSTAVLEAYDLVLRGHEERGRTTPAGNAEARRLFTRAVELDPAYSVAYAGLSWTHLQAWQLAWTTDPQTLERARELAERAVSLNDTLAGGYHLLAQINLWRKDYDRAIADAERAIALGPNDADSFETLAEILTWAGRAEDGVRYIRHAMRLNPRYPFYYLWTLGHALFLTGQREEALGVFGRLVQQNANFMPGYAYRAVLLVELGRVQEARDEWSKAISLSPRTSATNLRDRLPYKRQADLDRVLTAAHQAGIH
jgi:adenylate cyclase